MIIYKALKPIDITSGAVGNSAKALQENKYETTLQYGQFIEPPTIPDSESPGPKFAIIPPGSSYGLEAQVAVPVRFKPSPSLSGTIAHGTHVMSVQVADWPFTPDSGKQLQARWTNFGILNYGAMGSEPFEFTIPSAPNLQDCSEHQSQL